CWCALESRALGCTLSPYTTLFRSVRIVPAPSMATQLIRGEIDLVAGPGIGEVPLEDWELVKKTPHLRPVTQPSLGYQFVAINTRSEEHTSELQSRENLVCRLLLEK